MLIQERTNKFVSDLQRLVQLLEVDIDLEEQRTGVFDLASRDYSTLARDLRAKRDNLTATISRLERRPDNRRQSEIAQWVEPTRKRPRLFH
jgi:hypothetical protein